MPSAPDSLIPIAITLLVSAPRNDNKYAFLLAFSASAHLPSLWSFNKLIFISPTLKLNAAAENHKERYVVDHELLNVKTHLRTRPVKTSLKTGI